MPSTHDSEQFEKFLSQLYDTNATLDFYCDFHKISQNVENIAFSLNSLNYLIGKQDLRKAVEFIWNRDKKVFDVMDILIATRGKDNKMYFDGRGNFRSIHSLFSSVDGVMEFLDGTGLSEIFKNREIKNLVDYVFGVETGLDSNARKNRSGKITENLITKIFTKGGIAFRTQVASSEFPAIQQVLGTDQKIFDFVVEHSDITYLIEVNFYTGGGSKPNEVARSYSELAPKINSVKGYEFVWITDGIGWQKARNILQEAFNIIPKIYNLTTVDEFIRLVKNP